MNLFREEAIQQSIRLVQKQVQGLAIKLDVIGQNHEASLLKWIDEQRWETGLKRRVIQYGYSYSYQSSVPLRLLGPLPTPLAELFALVNPNELQVPNQVIINEYLPGQGIAPHIDDPDRFGEKIYVVSLGSDILLNWELNTTRLSAIIPSRSMYTMSGPSRYDWTHGVAPRKTDDWGIGKFDRSRRVSITFRTIK